jgi:two-component system OmpR family sensor kinase
MHFDDRLATVLRLPATSRAMARIQFRQLIDLLSRAPADDNQPGADRAFARLEELGAAIPAAERAAILREPMTRLANPALVLHLAAGEPEVAGAAIAAADLSQPQWLALIPRLPVHARGILRHRGDFGPRVVALLDQLGVLDRGLPPATEQAAPPRAQRPELVVVEGNPALPPRTAPASEPAGIGAIVRRIEAFRKARAAPDETDATNAPLPRTAPAVVLALDFTTDAEGRIDWADGPHAPGLVGRLLAAEGDASLRTSVRHRQPLRDVALTLAGAPDLAGPWRLDALPRFAGPDGRFLGYAGRLRRPARGAPAPGDARASAADSMRQVLHELRTPANAIQVAAEIIQQQLYGPAPHEYRALAAAIAGDTAQILAGFEELDRLVRLESGALSLASGACDLGAVLHETVARLRAWTAPRGSDFALPDTAPACPIALDREDTARLVWRLLAALAGAAAHGEVIALSLAASDGAAALSIDLPSALAERIDQSRTAGASNGQVRTLSAGIFGIGFTLRLAAAEAAAAGGLLARDGACLRLSLPGLTPAATAHTQA